MTTPLHGTATEVRRLGLLSGVTCFRDLERRIEALTSDQQRGDAFEVFAEAYLATQRLESAKQIWPDKVIPLSIRKRLRLSARDVGADGVIETTSGRLRAYQVKFRSGRKALTWSETATFFGVTDHCDDRLLFTNSEDVSKVAEQRKDFSSIRGTDLDAMTAEDFEAIRAWLAGKPVMRKKCEPRPYQQQALNAVLPALQQHDRATAVMACGTGKTFVALWAAEVMVAISYKPDAPARERTTHPSLARRACVLVLVPSLALLRQTLHEWLRNTSWEQFNYLCVCSDPTVTHGVDELVVRPTELEFPVKTKPEHVREFLTHSFAGVKIVFSTYQSAEVVARGMPRGLRFDIGIFDEAHKTAGRDGAKFSFALKDENLPIRKRLFLTATPRHYDLKRRDAEGEPVEVYSMNRPEIYGPVVHTLSFAEAAKQKIICNYKVVISVVTSEMLCDSARTPSRRAGGRQPPNRSRLPSRPNPQDRPRADAHRLASSVVGGNFQNALRHGTLLINGDEVKAQQVADQIALAQAVAEHRLKKIFTFHRYVASARSFTSDGSEGIGTHLPGFETLHVNGAMSTAVRDSLMTEFNAARRAVISNARCLTEGIDVPAVDMVAFLTPKRSKVDIVQAVGRAMRNAPGKTTGYILVPLYVEQSAGESLEAAVARAEFDEVWAVLQAMQEQDEVLDDLIHQMQAERRLTRARRGSPDPAASAKGFNDSRLRERVEVLGPTLTLDKLRRAIATRCLDRLARPWDEMVQLLVAYQKQHRHPRVPKSAPAPWTELGEWVDHVRALKRNGHLSAARQAQLDKLGFCWRVDGETLDSTEGLLTERQFSESSGLTMIADYRKRGLIKPVGCAVGHSGFNFFYDPNQIHELKRRLGITLTNTEGLLNETDFSKASGFTNIQRYRKRGVIKPIGFGITVAGVSPFYHPRQIGELKKALGITLDSTEGLLHEQAFRTFSGFSSIAEYRQQGLIKPVGRALSSANVSFFYHPDQIRELKKQLGITLDSTEGLLTERQFAKTTGLTGIAEYRKRGLIKPVGRGIAGTKIGFYYHRRQVDELKKRLGITLAVTEGLLNEREFGQASGLSRIGDYRKQGLIKPVGFGLTHAGISPFYAREQVAQLKKQLGITLDSTDGLLNEHQFAKASGLTMIADYRRRKLIQPVGFAFAGPHLSAFYRPRQVSELKKALGITLDSVEGLLNESQFRQVSGLTKIGNYRKRGLITPIGMAMSATKISPYYHPRQIAELKKRLAELRSR